MKKTYEIPEVEVTEFEIKDIVTASDGYGGDNDFENPWSKSTSTSYWQVN